MRLKYAGETATTKGESMNLCNYFGDFWWCLYY